MALWHRIEHSWTGAIIFVVLSPVILGVIGFYSYAAWLTYSFPRSVFGPNVGFTKVEYSKPLRGRSSKSHCTYAIIRFDEETVNRLTSEGPEAITREVESSWLQRADWKETPITFDPYEGNRDPIYCLGEMSPETKTEILSILKRPGNYQTGDALGRIGILSASHRLAAIIQTR